MKKKKKIPAGFTSMICCFLVWRMDLRDLRPGPEATLASISRKVSSMLNIRPYFSRTLRKTSIMF